MVTGYSAILESVRDELIHTRITGGGGTQLHIVQGGNRNGRPIVFIHGFSQCWLAWSRQFSPELADEYRLVAMDMRGHGQSDKPLTGYADSRLWADDLALVMDTLGLEQPVVCGWSYGPLVILDYIRHYGDVHLGGIHFVDGISKLGSEEAMAVISAEFRGLVPALFATDVEASVRSLETLLRMCFVREPSADELYQMLGYNVGVPPYVRQALFSRSFDNADVLASIRKPVLLTHGAEDAIVSPAVVEQHKTAVPHAQTRIMPKVGHAPFWEEAPIFNRDLAAFVEAC